MSAIAARRASGSCPEATSSRARACSSTVRASNMSVNAPRAPDTPWRAAALMRSAAPAGVDGRSAWSNSRRAEANDDAVDSPASKSPMAPPARSITSTVVAVPSRRATAGSRRKSSTSARPTGGTRRVTTRERMVGSSAPGSLLVRMMVVLLDGSSSSLSKAFAANSAPSCATMRSASPTTNTARAAMAGRPDACCSKARTVAT